MKYVLVAVAVFISSAAGYILLVWGWHIYKEGEREQSLPLITCESYSPVKEVCLFGRQSGVVSLQCLAAGGSNSW